MMTRWLSYIRLFDFEVKHVKGERNGGPDALSRRGRSRNSESDSESDAEESKTDAYFESKMCNITVEDSRATTTRVWMHEGEYEGEDLVIGKYLETLERPSELTDLEYQQLRKKAFTFLVRDGYLFKR